MLSVQCGIDLHPYAPTLATTCPGSSYLVFMTLVDTLLRDTCEVSDKRGRNVPRTVPDLEYDFVVIGAGVGGSTAAGRLAEEKSWKILLLEAGDDEPVGTQVPAFHTNFWNTSIDWKFKTEPEPVGCQAFVEKRCDWPRGKVVGGGSVINGMMYMRGSRADYQRWVKFGNTDWSYDKILADFKSFEDIRKPDQVDAEYHGKDGGPVTIEKFRYLPQMGLDIVTAGQQIGYNVSKDLSGRVQNGFSVAQMITRGGARLSLAKAFVRPQKYNSNFHLMVNSTVTKIVVDERNGTKFAWGVEFVYRNMTYKVKVKKEVIVSAGSIQTPQILFLSGIGGKDVLDSVGIKQIHDLPAVGKGLQNHVSFQIETVINRPNINLLNSQTVVEYISRQDGRLSSTGVTQVTARISTHYTTPEDPDTQIYFSEDDAKCARSGGPELVNPSQAKRRFFINPTYLHTKSVGYIGLHSKNPFHAPKIVANYLTNEQDVNGLIAGIRITQKFIASPIMKRKYGMTLANSTYGPCTNYKFDSDKFWECLIKYKTLHENHQGGSCKMGANRTVACVNQKLQIHGIENIRIMDASVFPTLPSANPMASIIMVSERGVKFIKEKYLNEVR